MTSRELAEAYLDGYISHYDDYDLHVLTEAFEAVRAEARREALEEAERALAKIPSVPGGYVFDKSTIGECMHAIRALKEKP